LARSDIFSMMNEIDHVRYAASLVDANAEFGGCELYL
jgi:hypothetical protein